MTIDLLAALRASARGLYVEEAAVELLIAEGSWLARRDFTEQFLSVGGGPAWGEPDMAAIDWAGAIDDLIGGRLPCSSGERAVLRIATSLAGHQCLLLGDALTSLDEANLDRAAAAVLHAGGRRPHHLKGGSS